MSSRFHIGEAPLDAAAVADTVAAPGCGALVTFIGVVRDENGGKQVTHLEYEAFELGLGEVSVIIAAASPHRADAFAASRYAIERIKQISPIWKHEHFVGGEVWIEGATANPDDEAARQVALERACS